MKEFIYRDNRILVNSDGSFTGTCLNEDDDVITVRKNTLEAVKKWIDHHFDNTG